MLAIRCCARFTSPGRHELCDVRTLGRKFNRRVCGLCAWATGNESKARGLRFDSGNLEQIRIIDAEDDQDDQSDDGRVVDAAEPSGITGGSVPYVLMD